MSLSKVQFSNACFHRIHVLCFVGIRFAIAGLNLQAPRVPGDSLPVTFHVGKSYIYIQ